jgi:hypothetical protein
MVVKPAYPDLVGSFKLNKSVFDPYDSVLVTVTITNTGDLAAGQFWVDFYVNPTTPPTTTNQPWDKSCGAKRCRYGIAWYVDETLEPGESITLTSTRGSYFEKNTDWPGYFVTDKLDLYLYVDSWNPQIASGAVAEDDESNNRSELHIASTRIGAPSARPSSAPASDEWRPLPDLPARPARPAEEQ